MAREFYKIYSVGGIHPAEGQLTFSAYKCFANREDAERFQVDCMSRCGFRWQWSCILEHTERVPTNLPPVEEFIELYWKDCIDPPRIGMAM